MEFGDHTVSTLMSPCDLDSCTDARSLPCLTNVSQHAGTQTLNRNRRLQEGFRNVTVSESPFGIKKQKNDNLFPLIPLHPIRSLSTPH